MGSYLFEGIRFQLYSDDHPPPHVHCFSAEFEAILDLMPDGTVQVAQRKDALRPRTLPRSIVRRMLSVAGRNAAELRFAWEQLHGGIDGPR